MSWFFEATMFLLMLVVTLFFVVMASVVLNRLDYCVPTSLEQAFDQVIR